MGDDVRLDILRDAIAASKLDGQTKDALADDLRYAQEINGVEDAALRGIKRLVISGIRRELLTYERMEKTLKQHIEKCPGARLTNAAQEAAHGQSHGLAKWLLILMPYRWPIALVCFSPFAANILERVAAMFVR